MTDAQKQEAYDRYQNAETEGTLIGLHNTGAVAPDFVNFSQNWVDVDPFSVDISHLPPLFFSKEAFYRTLFSTTFHTLYSNTLSPPAQGPGNSHIIEIERDGSNYVLKHYGLTQGLETLTLENPSFIINSSNMSFDAGVVKALFKLTNKFQNGVQVWNYQVALNGRLWINFYLVPFAFRE